MPAGSLAQDAPARQELIFMIDIHFVGQASHKQPLMIGSIPCRVLRELLGSVVAGCQGEAKQRKHLLSKALKRAHNVLGNHQLVSQVGPAHPVMGLIHPVVDHDYCLIRVAVSLHTLVAAADAGTCRLMLDAPLTGPEGSAASDWPATCDCEP